MPTSLPAMLGVTILLGLLHILLAAGLASRTRGAAWNVGNRDDQGAPLTPAAGRAARASANFLETFPLFAAALVCAIAMDRVGDRTELGVQLYFWARLAYLPVYLIGIPVLRTLLWTVAMAGLLIVVSVLF